MPGSLHDYKYLLHGGHTWRISLLESTRGSSRRGSEPGSSTWIKVCSSMGKPATITYTEYRNKRTTRIRRLIETPLTRASYASPMPRMVEKATIIAISSRKISTKGET